MLSRATRAIGAFAGLLGVAACSVFGGAAAPEPEYSVVLAAPPFELRDYCELVVAKTPMTDGSGAAFGRLFDYISGENSGARDIAMTAPVLQDRYGTREMVFVLPDEMTLQTAPVPTNLRVSLATIPPRRVAVVRYSGFLSRRAPTEEARLRDWLASKGLTPTGPAEIAGYNPPWTLPPFRRNEVLIPVESD